MRLNYAKILPAAPQVLAEVEKLWSGARWIPGWWSW